MTEVDIPKNPLSFLRTIFKLPALSSLPAEDYKSRPEGHL